VPGVRAFEPGHGFVRIRVRAWQVQRRETGGRRKETGDGRRETGDRSMQCLCPVSSTQYAVRSAQCAEKEKKVINQTSFEMFEFPLSPGDT
jgi:hypothetical protein